MTLREKIRALLKKMACDVTGKSLTAISEEEAIEVTESILQAVLDAMPEDFTEINYHNEEYAEGFNNCLTEVKKRVKE